MSTEAYEYRLYADSELKQLQATLQLRFRRWLTDWAQNSAVETKLNLQTDLAFTDSADDKWLVDEAAGLALSQSAQLWSFFSGICFAKDVSASSLKSTVLCQSILTKSLNSCLKELLHIDQSATKECVVLPPSLSQVGCLKLFIEVNGTVLSLLLSAALVIKLIDKPVEAPKPLPIFQLGQLPLTGKIDLNVHLHPTTISLGDFSSICIGDVIKLDHKVEQPFELRTGDNQIMGVAFPGVEDERLLVRISANKA